MERYNIECESLASPKDWICLQDTNQAQWYAQEIYRNDHAVILLCVQQQDFKDLFSEGMLEFNQDLDRLGCLAFQIQLQGECLKEVWRLIKKAKLSCRSPPGGDNSPGGC